MSTAKEVGNAIADLCRNAHFHDALDRYYAPDIVSVESMELPGMGREQHGIDAIRAKTTWWEENNEVHAVRVTGPFLAERAPDEFALYFAFEITPKATGQRVTFSEMGLYTVRQGKIVREEFFYATA
jgi:hypothetical protein